MKTVKFNELFVFTKKSNLKASESVDDGKYAFFTSSKVVSRKTDKPIYFEKSLVIGNGGSANIHYVDAPFSATSHCYIAVKTRVNLNIKYVYYYLLTNIHILERGFKGAGLKNISAKYIEEIDIPFVDLDIQDKIVAVLDKVQNLIEKIDESIEVYNNLSQAIFFDMFGDPDKNTKGWQIKKLLQNIEYIGDIGSNGSNALISKNLLMKDDKDYAIMVRTTNLRSNDFSNKVKYISKKGYDFFKKSKIFGGEFIINKIGSGAGDFWIMPNLNKKVSLGLNLLVIRPKNINIKFLFHYLSTEYGKMIVKSKVRGAAVQSITKKSIIELPIISPPIDLQNEFEKRVNKIELIKEKKQSILSNFQSLFFSLSQLAFKGELEFNRAVDLEVLMENDYEFFKNNSNKESITLLIKRLDKDELNSKKFYEQELYDKAKMFVFELLNEKKIKQVYDKETQRIKLTV
ncbi:MULTISPECIES: restriction endonuclease subunit S [Flavobacteriaceae]|uniref:Restriction endonuclease subunit S n=2 Tax=Flavobacteriaceae TaxID=49546 RepID=A0A4Y8ARJ6_9FLAO|nr:MULTISPECIES: restriction endonuclease subunit S [Flavobacteriaceae]TEW73825.1 restriction endonuclease subunit S [Gramella jeungdoensis]GGK37901.1 type I restriction modification enzyme, S subunit [Lutibacter litoralis]